MISVQCACGKSFRVASLHAGKKARCPECANPVPIPMPTPFAFSDEEPSELKKCPFCAEKILPAAVKCKYCGEHLKGATMLRMRARRRPLAPQVDNGGIDIFVCGILGWAACVLLGTYAWIRGNSYLRECRARNVQPNGMAVAGRIMGMVQTILVGGLVVLWLFMVLVLSAGR